MYICYRYQVSTIWNCSDGVVFCSDGVLFLLLSILPILLYVQ